MAKKKGKSFGDRLVRQLKLSMGPWWTDEGIKALNTMARQCDAEVSDATFGSLVLRPALSFQHEMAIREYDEQGKEIDDLSPFVYPELMRSWEHSGACVEFSEGFNTVAFDSEPGFVQSVGLEGLFDFFPGCLQLDVRKLDVSLYNISVDSIFVYPSYNAELGSVALMIVGVNQNLGFTFAYEARLVLEGDTFGDAARATNRVLDNQRAMCLGGMSPAPAEEFFSALDSEPELFAVTWRLLAALCSDRVELVRQKWGRGEHIKARSRRPDSQQLVEGVRVEEADPEPATQEEPAAEPVLEVAPEQAEGAGEVAEAGGEEGLEELVLLSEEIDILRAELERERASLAFRIKTLEREAAELREANAALSGRAALAETMELPETPYEALLLAERAFGDRIIVIERAKKSAAEFVKGDPGEVWSVLRSVAVTLHALLFVERERGLANAFRDRTGYELALRDAKGANRNAEQKAERMVDYEGETRDATMHIKGRGVRKGESLRVHFFVDYGKSKIVVVHCGEHLTTDRTGSM